VVRYGGIVESRGLSGHRRSIPASLTRGVEFNTPVRAWIRMPGVSNTDGCPCGAAGNGRSRTRTPPPFPWHYQW